MDAATANSDDLEKIVIETRRQLRRNTVFTTVAAGIAGTVGWLLLAASMDMLVPLSIPLRIIAFVIFSLLLVGLCGCTVIWFALRPMGMHRIAQRIEQTVPGMHNRLVTVLDLRRRNDGKPLARSAFVDCLIQQTRQHLHDYHVGHVANAALLVRLTTCATCVTTAAVVLMLFSERIPNAMARVLQPTAPIPPASYVRIAVPGDPDNLGIEVLEGNPVNIDAIIERGAVKHLTLRLFDAQARESNYAMTRFDESRFTYPISAVNASFTYQILGGNTWTVPRRISMLRRPILEHFLVKVFLPAYLAIGEPRIVEEEANQISAPIGATVELRAQVRGEPNRGEVQLFKQQIERVDRTVVSEAAWFDDKLPPDVELAGAWKWTPDQAHSGTLGHTFSRDTLQYGFTTRLHKLILERDESFFVYVWLDPANPPGQLRIRAVMGDNQEQELIWGTPPPPTKGAPQDVTATETDAALRSRTVFRGNLPAAEQWLRLDVPLDALIGYKPTGPVKLSGLTFQIDRGRAFFDRAGSLRTTTHTAELVKMSQTATVAMNFDPASDEWVGRIPVHSDVFYAVRFFNRSGYPSEAMKPVRITATTDQPPTLLVEKPGENITVAQIEPLPMVLRVFDDFGVKHVSVRLGIAANALGDENSVKRYDQPKRSQMLLASLDPGPFRLQPGQSLFYRFVVQDFKNQATESDLWRITLAKPGQTLDNVLPENSSDLNKLLKTIADLVSLQNDLSVTATILGRTIFDGAAVGPTDEQTPQWANADETPLTALQVRHLLNQRSFAITQQEQQQLARLERQLAEQSRLLESFAEDLDSAAIASEQARLGLPNEAWMLRALADRARDMATLVEQWQPPFGVFDSAVILEAPTFDEMAAQLRQMVDARQMLGLDPTVAQSHMADLMADMRAKGAVQVMDDLADVLEAQQADLGELREQVVALAQQAKTAQFDELDDLSKQQERLDKDVLSRLEQIQTLFQTSTMTDLDSHTVMLAPWTPPRPPRRPVQVVPIERGAPNEEEELRRPLPDTAQNERADLDWWDMKVNVGPMPRRGLLSERFANRDQPMANLNQADLDFQRTPRQLLTQHQDQLNQQLAISSNQIDSSLGHVEQLCQQMQQMLDRLDSASSPRQGDLERQQIRKLLESQRLDRMMSLAERAAALRRAMRQTLSPDEMMRIGVFPGADRTGSLRPAYIISMEFDDLELSADQRAAVYRLPPKLREPLVRSMKQRAPEGYQPLIEAYYRQLGKEEQ